MAPREIDEDDRSVSVMRWRPGWFRVTFGYLGLELLVGCSLDAAGYVAIDDLVVRGNELAAADLRRIPLGRVLAALSNKPCMDWITQRAEPDPVWDELYDVPEGPGLSETNRAIAMPALPGRPDRSDPDRFYRMVAEVYRWRAERSSKPALLMAEQADVPVATARRWIAEARRRGHLAPGSRGRAL